MYPRRRSHLYNLLVALLLWGLFLSIIIFWGELGLFPGASDIGQVTGVYAVLSCAALVLLTGLRWWKRAGLTTPGRIQHLPLYLIPFLVALLSLPENPSTAGPSTVVSFAILTLLVGFAEEVFFRGLILGSLRPLGTVNAVLISAFLFGLPHLLNAVGGTWDPLFTIADTFAALGIGVTFAALAIRTGTIWPLIGIHALIDFTALLTHGSIVVPAQPVGVLVVTVAVGVVLVVYGLYLIRPRQEWVSILV